MNRKSAARTCATLERREAAFVRAAHAEARRCEASRVAEEQVLHASRELLALRAEWPSTWCGFIHLCGERRHAASDALSVAVGRASRAAAEHEAVRGRWASLVRGLQRRAERRARREAPWRG